MRLWIWLPIVMAACAAPARREATPTPLSLREGESVTAVGVTLRFTAVEVETRCPPRANCVRAGEARIALEASGRGEAPTLLRLWTFPEDSTARAYGGHVVRLDSLSPRPGAPRERYRAWVTVSARRSGG